MNITIENIKALEPGKIYAIQVGPEISDAGVEEICKELRTFSQEMGLNFIILRPGLSLVEVCEATLEALKKEPN